MYGTSTLRISDTRPSLQTVGPLYQKSVLQGKRQRLLAAFTGRSASLPAHRRADPQPGSAQPAPSGVEAGAHRRHPGNGCGTRDRYGDFDRNFHPLETHTRSRWLSIAVARLNGQAMPAVELIKVGDAYAVRDGHHRISVARALGEDYIDAHVTAWELAD